MKNQNGEISKTGLLVLLNAEAEPKPCTENAFLDLPQKLSPVKEKLSLLELVMKMPVKEKKGQKKLVNNYP